MSDLLLVGLCIVVVALTLRFLADDYLSPIGLFTLLNIPLFFVRPIVLLFDQSTPRYPFLFWSDPSDLAREALIVFLVSYVAFAAGYAWRSPLREWLARQLPAHGSVRFSLRRMRILTVTAVAASVLGIGFLVQRSGGIAAFMIGARTGGLPGMYLFLKMPMVASFLSVLLVTEELRRKRSIVMGAACLVACLLLILTTGDRSGVIAPLMALVVVFHFTVRRLPGLQFALLASVGLLVLSLLSALRLAVFTGAPMGTAVAEALLPWTSGSGISHLGRSLNLDMVDYFLVILQDFTWETLHFGKDFVIGVIGVVPRAIWPEKPDSILIGNWFALRYLGRNVGMPITATGEWWLNFGIPGVIVGGFLSGMLFRSIWAYVQKNDYATWSVLLYMVYFLNVTAYGMIGTTLFVQLVYWAVPLWAAYRWAGTSAPEAALAAHGDAAIPAQSR